MPCYHPIKAWRTTNGIQLGGPEHQNAVPLRLPCGGCLGCRTAKAKEWALRCHLELQNHRHAAFTTLTYDDKNKPVTLERRHLQLFLKRLRSKTTQPLRFFASGEYGETTYRPHYHAIIFGVSPQCRHVIQDAWGMGHTHTANATPATIAYVAGYTSKKTGWQKQHAEERVDPATGELYHWQPPFIQMSRRPGIGASAREHAHSWRLFAIHNNARQPVPRFLHEAWKQQASLQDKEDLIYEKSKFQHYYTEQELQTREQIAQAKQKQKQHTRRL